MSATYLIDGYNLLYAMGVLGGPVGPHGLEKARLRLLGLLHGSFAEESFTVTVVFDAAAGETPEKRQGLSEEETRKWIAEFGDLEKDHSLRAAFEPFDFEE